jgi:hypothetical protein
MTRRRFAIIVTRDRPEAYAACVAAIRDQVDDIVTITHGPTAITYATGLPVRYDPEPPNISAMWNLGLDLLTEAFPRQAYDVAVLNDDSVVPAYWFDHISGPMSYTGAAAGCVDQHHRLERPVLHVEAAPVDLHQRLTGYAFILDGSKGIRANEEMRWWLSDDDIDWQARTRGGTIVVPGEPVQHPPNGGTACTGRFATWFEEDQIKFRTRWGVLPW